MHPGPLLALLVLVTGLLVVAYYPFTWDPPRHVRNAISREADGSLRFGGTNRARTDGTPGWLRPARNSGWLDIRLIVLPQRTQDPSIMMLAKDYWHCDFAVAQTGSGMSLWLRREGSTVNGDPPIVVDDVFRPGRWTTIAVSLRDERVTITIDGVRRLDRRISKGLLRQWEDGRIALGGEVNGGGDWQGLIRVAEVRTVAGSIDYVAPGALTIPTTYLHRPDRVMPFPPPSPFEWFALLFHLASFVPLGFLVVASRHPPVGLRSAALIGTGAALILAGGKFLFARHTAIADVGAEALGALVGALVASRRRPMPNIITFIAVIWMFHSFLRHPERSHTPRSN